MAITLDQLAAFKAAGDSFSCLTCYDATFAKAMELAKIDTILVGDSLGMVVQGHNSTLPVTIDDMVYHTRAVSRANHHAFIMADMPFMSYATLPDALYHAKQLMQAGAHAVKLEGGAWLCETVTQLARNGIPSCVHLGLTPQSVNLFGGYRVQNKTKNSAQQLLAEVQQLVAAGAKLLLLECVPMQLAALVQQQVDVPVIGIGAGVQCDGQVLVMHDMLGLNFGQTARFVHNFLADVTTHQDHSSQIVAAFAAYHQAVHAKQYPQPQHGFDIPIDQ